MPALSSAWLIRDRGDRISRSGRPHAAAEVAVGHQPEVRDWGLPESALARPKASVFGEDAYAGLTMKAAALLHSLVTSHGLVDANMRLGLVAVLLFLGMNGCDLEATEDERVELVLAVAGGTTESCGRDCAGAGFVGGPALTTALDRAWKH